jgi:hypothetical protein
VAPFLDGLVGVPAVGLGLLALAIGSREQGEGSGFAVVFGGMFVIGGAPFLASSIYGDGRNRRCSHAEQTNRALLAHVELARSLTEAASTGDCAVVATLEDRLCDVDRELHDTTLSDAALLVHCPDESTAIARCALRSHDHALSEPTAVQDDAPSENRE